MVNFLDKFSLKGKVAYLTGGLGLIGKEISIALVIVPIAHPTSNISPFNFRLIQFKKA